MNFIRSLFVPRELSSEIITIHDFLTKSECKGILEILNKYNFYVAHQFNNGRHNSEMFIEDEQLMGLLISKIRALKINNSKQVIEYHKPFEFYRYDNGDYILPHQDSSLCFDSGNYSNFTAIIYLNDDYQGGFTFFNETKRQIKPKTGTLLLFKHHLLHEAKVVTSGTKFIYRSNWYIN
jgi:prolyl 4-hydroxylase